ncbi:MAG TPA: MFS transporter [Pirellulales bacterium]
MPACRRRTALGWGHVNGACWSIGTALTSGTLVVYLAIDLGAGSEHVSLLLAAPAVVGLLRLAAPLLIRVGGGPKRTCLAMLLTAYVLLLALPAIGWAGQRLAHPVAALIALLCVHQLFEYIGTVALWSWFADVVPLRIRGRYFARRQVWQLATLMPALWASGAWVDHWKNTHADAPLVAYFVMGGMGAGCLLLSLVPLALMPESFGPLRRSPPVAFTWPSLVRPLADRNFRRLLAFGCWFSCFNGLTQSPQSIFPKSVLGIGLFTQSLMRTLMQGVQAGVSLLAGRLSDRYGNQPVLVASQIVVACGPLFFLAASPAEPDWLFGAFFCWGAYAGINVCLPNLMLKLADPADRSPYIACYFAVTSLCYAAATVAGGYAFPWAARTWFPGSSATLDLYRGCFFASWLLRTLGIVWLLRIREPGAWTWRPSLPPGARILATRQ